MSEDTISRQAAIDAMKSISDSICEQQAIDALCELPSAQPDLDEVYAHAETEAEARYHAEIVRCKDCKHRTSYWGNCRLLEEKYHQSVLVDGDSFCSMAERRTDDR